MSLQTTKQVSLLVEFTSSRSLLRRLSGIIGALVLTCTLLVTLADSIGAELPPAELAFVAVKNGSYDLMLLDANRGAIAPLTRSGFPKEPPVWSPDGARIAFVARGGSSGLYVVDTDGRNLRRIADGIAGRLAVWSPDGQRLAYVGLRGGGFILNVLDVDSGHIFAVTEQDGPIGTPTWSPDGAHLVFGISTGPFHGLYAVRASGGSPASLSTEPARSPAWSPDGRRLVFNQIGDQGGLFVLPAGCVTAGAGCTSAARTRIEQSLDSAGAWSPDGQSLAYFLPDGCPDPYRSLYVWSSGGASARRLLGCRTTTNLIVENRASVWSPDAREIVLTLPDGLASNLYGVGVADGALRRLTTLPDTGQSALYPAWKP